MIVSRKDGDVKHGRGFELPGEVLIRWSNGHATFGQWTRGLASAGLWRMVLWGVVGSEIEQVIEFFRTRREAERMLAEVIRDEPDWLEHFRIERIELGSQSLN